MWGHREKMGAPSFRLVLAKGWQRRSSSGVIPSEVAPNGARPSRRIGCHRLPHFRNHRPPHRRNAAILYITDFLLARSLPSKLETFPSDAPVCVFQRRWSRYSSRRLTTDLLVLVGFLSRLRANSLANS